MNLYKTTIQVDGDECAYNSYEELVRVWIPEYFIFEWKFEWNAEDGFLIYDVMFEADDLWDARDYLEHIKKNLSESGIYIEFTKPLQTSGPNDAIFPVE